MLDQYGPWIVVINIAIGLALGLIPLSIGLIRGRAKYGLYGFLSCLIGGGILGVFLSIPACIFFSWLCVRQPKPADSVETDADASE